MKLYDYIIVGSGLYGVVCARLLTNKGYSCLILDKRTHVGGNCHSEKRYGIDVHMYGPHIFHTSDKKVWDFVNKYTEFIPYLLNVKANYKGNIYSLPFNMNTFHELYGINNSFDAILKIKQEVIKYEYPKNLEEQALSQVGKTIYKKLIKGYTEKQWNKSCTELPASIIQRLPICFEWNNDYYHDVYLGLPINGYTNWILNIINGSKNENPIEYLLNVDFSLNKEYLFGKNIIYCGEVDKLINYSLGELEWRSLSFNHVEVKNSIENDLGCSNMNYTSKEVPYTRVIDLKYLTPFYKPLNTKILTYEFPEDYIKDKTEAYYPINNEKNNKLYLEYVELIKKIHPNIILGGRLGLYKYLDMDDTIKLAIYFCLKI